MTDRWREFICVDCKAHVYNYGGGEDRGDRCYNCYFIRNLELSPDKEAELREVLGCELVEAHESLGGDEHE